MGACLIGFFHPPEYRIAQNFGRFGGLRPIHQGFIREKLLS